MNKYLLYAKPSNDAFMLVGKHNEEKPGWGGDMGTWAMAVIESHWGYSTWAVTQVTEELVSDSSLCQVLFISPVGLLRQV